MQACRAFWTLQRRPRRVKREKRIGDVAYMRNKEKLELILDYTNKLMVKLDKIVLGGLEGSMDSKTLAMRYFYHDMLYFINIE